MKSKFHVIILCLLTAMYHSSVDGQELEWTEIENGIWKTSVGEPEDISLLKAVDVQPKEKALDKLPSADFSL